MTGEEVYEIFRHHMLRLGIVRDRWHYLSDGERSAWDMVAREANARMEEAAGTR